MTHRCLIAIFCLSMLCSGLSHADIALRYKMTPGETLVYQCTTTGNGLVHLGGASQPLVTNSAFTYLMSCTAVDMDGKLTVVHRVEDLKAEAALGGQALPVSLSLPVLTTVMEATGRVLDVRVQRSDSASDLGAALGGGLLQRSSFDVGQFFGDLRGPGFPVEPVGPGSRWQDAVQMTTQAGQPLILSYITKFLDYAVLNERDCARLQTDYRLPLDLSLSGGDLFTLSGEHKGTQIAYFDYQAGRTLRYDGTADTRMTMSTPQLFAGASQVAVSMNVRSSVCVVLETVRTE